MVAVVGTRAAGVDIARRFRREAHEGRVARGAAPGHRDGWGIAYADANGALRYAGRSTADAATDPAYTEALDTLAAGAGARGVAGASEDQAARSSRIVMLAHVRKMTLGAKAIENTHPFLAEGLALAHNGTVHGFAAPGQNDTRALFARLLDERRRGASVGDALVALARDVEARSTFTSLTLLVTDGASLWGLRLVGNDPVACAPEACASDYYTLGHATLADGSVVLSQEHEVLGLAGWTPIADGALVHVDPHGRIRTRLALEKPKGSSPA